MSKKLKVAAIAPQIANLLLNGHRYVQLSSSPRQFERGPCHLGLVLVHQFAWKGALFVHSRHHRLVLSVFVAPKYSGEELAAVTMSDAGEDFAF